MILPGRLFRAALLDAPSSALVLLALPFVVALGGCATGRDIAGSHATVSTTPMRGSSLDADAAMRKLADDYVAAALEADPTLAYGVGLEASRHDRLEDRSPAALARRQAQEDELLRRLEAVDAATLVAAPAQIAHAQLRELLESAIAVRVCRLPDWFGVNHMAGWHLDLASYAEAQPVDTPQLRAQALLRWRTLPGYVDTEIANLRRGLADGFSMPKSVVARVLQQVAGLASATPVDSDFAAPARHAADADFQAEFTALVRDEILPALQRYEAFLRDEYLPAARSDLAVTSLPDGEACYRALLRQNTTLDRSPREVYELGERNVAANEAKVRALGETLFGTADLSAIVQRVGQAPDNRFGSEAELLAFSREANARARAAIVPYFDKLPAQDVAVEPPPAHERGSGRSSHYEAQDDPSKPGVYRINLDTWATDLRGTAEITVAHENWPGHHLQIAYSRDETQTWPLSKLAFNSAYVEGWGRYAEALAEEAGFYRTDYARISRRIWPARGMVADPGIHAFGWSRERAVAYLVATGRFTQDTAQASVDRVAALPGQWTSYDSGGIEIAQLREAAERELGDRFDIRQFHAVVLGSGVVPLSLLRANVRRWIASQEASTP